jgi:hypothetical protein
VKDKGEFRQMAVLKDRMFDHLQRTALVIERLDENERKLRRKVRKLGSDPHFSYANMLCDVAYSRAHGRATFVLPDGAPGDQDRQRQAIDEAMPGLPLPMVEFILPLPPGEVCGRCTACSLGPHGPPEKFWCERRRLNVRAEDAGCPIFVPAE